MFKKKGQKNIGSNKTRFDIEYADKKLEAQEEKNTLLLTAVEQGNEEEMFRVFDNVNITPQEWQAALQLSVQRGYTNITEALFKNNSSLKATKDLVAVAALDNHIGVLNVLFCNGADIQGDGAILFSAIGKKVSTEIIIMLLENGANVNYCTYKDQHPKWSVLHEASQVSDAMTVEALLRYKADVNARAGASHEPSLTPLHCAVSRYSEEKLGVISVLLKYGARDVSKYEGVIINRNDHNYYERGKAQSHDLFSHQNGPV